MKTKEELIARFKEVADNPNAYVIDWKRRTGRKAFGAMPPFAPNELIYASGALPVGTWGGEVKPTDAFQYFPTFYCSILTTTLQLGIQGSFRELDAFVCGTGCDGLQDMMEDWRLAVPSIPVIPCIYPQRRDLEVCKQYMIDELRIAGSKMSKITGIKITDITMQEAMYLYNDHRAAMREFSLLAGSHLDVVTPIVRHDVFKSAHFMDRKEHLQLVKEFNAILKAEPEYDFKGIRVVATGLIFDSKEMLQMFEENNIGIVGDDIVSESKQYETDIENGIDLYYQLAKQWCDRKGCCIIQSSVKERGPMLVDMVKARKADGVVVNTLKFCEPEAYDYPIIRKVFQRESIPELHLQVENQYSNDHQASTKIQAFCEMLQ